MTLERKIRALFTACSLGVLTACAGSHEPPGEPARIVARTAPQDTVPAPAPLSAPRQLFPNDPGDTVPAPAPAIPYDYSFPHAGIPVVPKENNPDDATEFACLMAKTAFRTTAGLMKELKKEIEQPGRPFHIDVSKKVEEFDALRENQRNTLLAIAHLRRKALEQSKNAGGCNFKDLPNPVKLEFRPGLPV